MVEVLRLRAAGKPTVPEDMGKSVSRQRSCTEIVGPVAPLIRFGIIRMAERRQTCERGWQKQEFHWVEFVLGKPLARRSRPATPAAKT